MRRGEGGWGVERGEGLGVTWHTDPHHSGVSRLLMTVTQVK